MDKVRCCDNFLHVSSAYPELLDKVENVDPYEAGTRALQFEKQLTISYQITARLQNLSLTNFL